MFGVVLLGLFARGPEQFHAHGFESTALESADDFADKPPLNCVGLEQDQGPLDVIV